jgi:hypothetical protein
MMVEKDKLAKGDPFWTRYKRFAVNEILLYLIMVIGIIAGLLILV